MTQPVVDRWTQEAYDALGPWKEGDEATGWQLLYFVKALWAPLVELNEVVRDRDGESGWSWLFEIDTAPEDFLPWVAQFVGVVMPGGITDAQQRDYIRDAAGWKRGTLAAMSAAARLLLTGGKQINVEERYTGDAYKLRITTYLAETPDAAAVEAVLRSLKPAGIVLTYQTVTGSTYTKLDTDFTTYAAMDAAFGTYEDQTLYT